MRFDFGTLKRTISALVLGALLVVGFAVPAEAQRGRGRGWERHDNGRHLGWTRGRHRGWRNRDRRDFRRERRLERRRDRRDDRRFTGLRTRAFNRDRRFQSRQFRAQQRFARRSFRRDRF